VFKNEKGGLANIILSQESLNKDLAGVSRTLSKKDVALAM
jgi:hypothetical protein